MGSRDAQRGVAWEKEPVSLANKGDCVQSLIIRLSHCTYQLTGPNPLPIKCHWAVDEAGACVGRIQGGQNNSAAN